MNDEPEAKNEATVGERGECLLGAAVRRDSGVGASNLGIEPAAGTSAGKDTDTEVVGSSVGLLELRGGQRMVMKTRSQGPTCITMSYLSIFRL